MKRAKLDMVRRNALIVIGNRLREGGSPVLLEHVQRLARDENETDLVRQTAQDVLLGLGAGDG